MPATQYFWKVKPVPEPRMSRSDKWKERPCVMRYFAFRDEIRLLLNGTPEIQEAIETGRCYSLTVDFCLPMPDSWSKKKKANFDGKFHHQKPDIDNLMKALMDSLFGLLSDEEVSEIHARKFWASEGSITISL
jgi:Holliday junction resolvase RusA-like endonuclease